MVTLVVVLATAQCEVTTRDWYTGDLVVRDAQGRAVLEGAVSTGTTWVKLAPGKAASITNVTAQGKLVGFLEAPEVISLRTTKPVVVAPGALIMPGTDFEAPAGGPWVPAAPESVRTADGKPLAMPAVPCGALTLAPPVRDGASADARFVGRWKDVGTLFGEGHQAPVMVHAAPAGKPLLRLEPTAPVFAKVKERKKGWAQLEVFLEPVVVTGWVEESAVLRAEPLPAIVPEVGIAARPGVPPDAWRCSQPVKLRAFGEPIFVLAPEAPVRFSVSDAGVTTVELFDHWSKPVEGVQLELSAADATSCAQR